METNPPKILLPQCIVWIICLDSPFGLLAASAEVFAHLALHLAENLLSTGDKSMNCLQ